MMLDHGLRFRFGVSLVVALVSGSAALASGPLFPGVQYGVGEWPRSVAVGDLNGDEWLDLAVANYFSDNVSVLLNNGDGTFAAAVHYDVRQGSCSVAVGDLNGDECLDLAVANGYSANVSVLLNNGDGTFAPAVNYAVDYGPRSITIGDLNGDQWPDLALATAAAVSVLLNNGDGTFAPPMHPENVQRLLDLCRQLGAPSFRYDARSVASKRDAALRQARAWAH